MNRRRFLISAGVTFLTAATTGARAYSVQARPSIVYKIDNQSTLLISYDNGQSWQTNMVLGRNLIISRLDTSATTALLKVSDEHDQYHFYLRSIDGYQWLTI